MLAEINGYTLHQPILKTLLRSFLPYIIKNEEWSRYMTLLSKVRNIYLVKDNKLVKQNDNCNKCPICEKFIFQQNLFILILHMEIEHEALIAKRYFINQHEDSLVVKKYQFTYDGLQIHLVRMSTINQTNKKETSSKKSQKLSNLLTQSSLKDYVVYKQSGSFISSSLKQRNTSLLQRIFSKFSKRLQTISAQRKYYHSYNVYRPIGPDSDQQNSQNQRQEIVERQFQRLRINDFSDVSYWDKLLFLEWNNLVRRQKKQLKVLYEAKQIVSVLEKFVIICKQKQIPKINFNMHLYTLWSIGRIKDFHIIGLLTLYDTYSDSDYSKPINSQ